MGEKVNEKDVGEKKKGVEDVKDVQRALMNLTLMLMMM